MSPTAPSTPVLASVLQVRRQPNTSVRVCSDPFVVAELSSARVGVR